MQTKTLVFAVTLLIHILFSSLAFPFLFGSSGLSAPITPVLGLSLGLYLIFGWPALLATFLGFTFTEYQTNPFVMSSITGFAYTVQLVATNYLLAHLIKIQSTTSSTIKLFRLMIIIGPIACTIACTIDSLAVIGLNGVLSVEGIAHWITCGMKDMFSVLFFTSPLLMVIRNPYLTPLKKTARHILVVISIYCLSIGAFSFSHEAIKHGQQQQFQQLVQPYIQQLKVSENAILGFLKAMEGLFHASENVTREEFKYFTENLHTDGIHLRAMAWLPYVADSETGVLIEQAKKDGIEDYEIRAVTDKGIITSPKRSFYIPIFYTEPLKDNRGALGIDVSTHPVVSNLILNAIEEKKLLTSPLIKLVQQQDKATGFIVYTPLLNHNSSSAIPRGFLQVVLELDILLEGISQRVGNQSYGLRFQYSNQETLNIGQYDVNSSFYWQETLPFFNRTITIHFTGLPAYTENQNDYSSWMLQVITLVIGLFISIFIYTVSNDSEQLEKQVLQKTQELTQTNQRLETANKAQSVF